MNYSPAFKAKMVKKMSVPGGWNASALSLETGVPQTTLSRWLRDARSVDAMSKRKDKKRKRKKWTAKEKLRVVTEAEGLSGEELGALLRREGIHEAQLREWRQATEEALDAAGRNRKGKEKESDESKRIKELEKELHRKEKALAEASALLVLKKKMEDFSADEDDDMDGRNGK